MKQDNPHSSSPAGKAEQVLVGDIGGTNARFAIAGFPDGSSLSHLLSLKSAEYGSLEAAVEAYLRESGVERRPSYAVIAVAGPVTGGVANLTNLSWQVSETALKRAGFRDAALINDFRALAASAETFGTEDLTPIGAVGDYDPQQNVAIIGAGTGLGISALVRENGETVAVSSEGGHAGFAPGDALEADVVRVLTHRFGHVSAERLLSGPGLVNIYNALCELRGEPAAHTEPPAIAAEAGRQDGPCRQAVHVFCNAMASVAGDLALTFGARGGVLLTGGVTASLQRFLDSASFRTRFEAKGRLSGYLKTVPTFLIAVDNAALLGCARFAVGRFHTGGQIMKREDNVNSTTQPVTGFARIANGRSTLMVPLVIFLFFAWGFTTSLNDPLIAKLKGLFSLSYAEVMLTQSAFFLGYCIFSIPSGIMVNKLGYIRSIALGLAVMAVGCLLFAPAAMTGIYSSFLGALFIVAAGMALLQVAANPYIAVLGSAKNSSSRLTFAQSFNSLGTFFGPLVGALFLLQRGVEAPTGADEKALHAARVAEASLVQMPFLIIAAVLLAVALVFWLLRRMPSPPTDVADVNPFSWRVLRRPRLMLGVGAIFLYVGAEVAIGSGLTNYLMQDSVVGNQAAAIGKHTAALLTPLLHHEYTFNVAQVAGAMVSIYWGLAMIGRFIGSGVLALVKPGKVLMFNALLAVVLALVSSQTTGMTAAVAVLAIGLANSIMFPTIFTLALEGLGEDTSKGSALLCTAIVGGSVIPYAYGVTADHSSLALALLVPAACYVLIAGYGWFAARTSKQTDIAAAS